MESISTEEIIKTFPDFFLVLRLLLSLLSLNYRHLKIKKKSMPVPSFFRLILFLNRIDLICGWNNLTKGMFLIKFLSWLALPLLKAIKLLSIFIPKFLVWAFQIRRA